MAEMALRERVRRALQDAAMHADRSQPLRLLDETAAAYADATLAAIEASGWAVVPVEPTEEMWRAGVRTLANHQNSPAALDEIMGLVYGSILAARPR